MKRLWRSRKALSPVVAAIILIAVTVAVSIAVAAWMGALTFTWMGYEGLDIPTCRWEWSDTAANRVINITVVNDGTKDVTINHIEVNHVGIGSGAIVTGTLPHPFATGANPYIIRFEYPYVNGTSYDISVVTTTGYEFTDHFTGGQDET